MKHWCYSLMVLVAACARDDAAEQGSAAIEAPAAAPQETPVEEAPDERATYGFKGTITELRQLEPARAGLSILLQDVVILSASKPKGLFYVADALGGEYAGIEVSLCEACRKTSVDVAVTVNVAGVLRLEAGDRYIIEQAKFVVRSNARAEVPKVSIPTAFAMSQDSGRFVGGYVQLVDAQTDAPSRFIVVDREPRGAKNDAYPESLDTLCSFDAVASAACCAFGPKYRYFVVEESQTHERVNVSAAPFQSFGAPAWPCAADDLPNVLQLGDEFTSLAGIIDVHDHVAMLVPTSAADCPLQR